MKPEALARAVIDRKLTEAGWSVQDRKLMNLSGSSGVAVREFPTSTGPVDYLLFVDGAPIGVIEAKESEEGEGLTSVEQQSSRYLHSTLIGVEGEYRLRFAYEATDEIIRFTDTADEKCRSRQVYSFHRPETLRTLLNAGSSTLRNRLKRFPELDSTGFRDCQTRAITSLEKSFAENRPRALIQMATGAGKTFTAISSVYRLLKYGRMNRVLFLVDTRSLGEQAEREFLAYKPTDDPRSFASIYGVARLKSPAIPKDCSVYISTIQRMYSLLKGEPLNEEAEEHSGDSDNTPREVIYNGQIPPEFFDCIIVDECHRSIYNVWSQVLEYFDAFLVGLTATPDKRTLGYFHQNLVSEYTRAQAIADGVNVSEDIFLIETDISRNGATILKNKPVAIRDRRTRRKRWETFDDDLSYSPTQLNADIVNPSQIRTIIRSFRNHVFASLFPERSNVPKTLIFAKDDSHADDIVQMVREEFGEGNEFCQKITYRADNPETVLNAFRNSFYPRIAVTVDMIATGTDVKPLECLIFMRDVRSKSYYEQMVGRGTRTLDKDGLQAVSPDAKAGKDHFVIVDAIGVTTSPKSESCEMEHKPGVSLRELLEQIARGVRDEGTLTSTANRMLRLAVKMTRLEHEDFVKAVGISIRMLAKRLLAAFDPDTIAEEMRDFLVAAEEAGDTTEEEQYTAALADAQLRLAEDAVAPLLRPEVRELMLKIQRTHNQVLDTENIDTPVYVGWDLGKDGKADEMLTTFRGFIERHRDELTALGIIYTRPYKLRTETIERLKVLAEELRALHLSTTQLGRCYDVRDNKQRGTMGKITDLVTLIRYELGLADELLPFGDLVRANYKRWIFRRNAGKGQFSEEQNKWLKLIRDHIITSLNITEDDMELEPFAGQGGLARFYQLFGAAYRDILEEMNIELVG